VAQRNDRPAGAIQQTEFGLQVRLPQVLIFSHLQNTGSHCDACVTQLNGVGRKLGFRLLENRLACETGKRADHTPFLPKVRELTFLRNHREAIAAMDFFTVPTLTFGVLHCFFVIGHDRRKILHCKVTRNPHAVGGDSNCEKPGPTNSRTDSCYSTTTRSLAPMWFRP
jgi:hypothetical protein